MEIFSIILLILLLIIFIAVGIFIYVYYADYSNYKETNIFFKNILNIIGSTDSFKKGSPLRDKLNKSDFMLSDLTNVEFNQIIGMNSSNVLLNSSGIDYSEDIKDVSTRITGVKQQIDEIKEEKHNTFFKDVYDVLPPATQADYNLYNIDSITQNMHIDDNNIMHMNCNIEIANLKITDTLKICSKNDNTDCYTLQLNNGQLKIKNVNPLNNNISFGENNLQITDTNNPGIYFKNPLYDINSIEIASINTDIKYRSRNNQELHFKENYKNCQMFIGQYIAQKFIDNHSDTNENHYLYCDDIYYIVYPYTKLFKILIKFISTTDGIMYFNDFEVFKDIINKNLDKVVTLAELLAKSNTNLSILRIQDLDSKYIDSKMTFGQNPYSLPELNLNYIPNTADPTTVWPYSLVLSNNI